MGSSTSQRRAAMIRFDGSLLANRCGIRVAFSGINFLAEHESIRYNAVHYGYSFDYSCRSCRWRNREAIDAGERSWWFYRHDSARHRWRVHCQLPRPGHRLVQGGTTSGLDHVDRRRHNPVAALSVAFQAQTIAFAIEAKAENGQSTAALQNGARAKINPASI